MTGHTQNVGRPTASPIGLGLAPSNYFGGKQLWRRRNNPSNWIIANCDATAGSTRYCRANLDAILVYQLALLTRHQLRLPLNIGPKAWLKAT